MFDRSRPLLTLMVFLLLRVTTVNAADPGLSGTVVIKSTSVAAGIGVQWGDGILTLEGKQYPFSLQGLQAVGIGFTEVTAEGTVSGLKKLSDFEGVYAAAEAGAAAGSGPTTITMRNPNGATIALHAVQEGVNLTLAGGGTEIKLKK